MTLTERTAHLPRPLTALAEVLPPGIAPKRGGMIEL
jgi:hypothetical protein